MPGLRARARRGVRPYDAAPSRARPLRARVQVRRSIIGRACEWFSRPVCLRTPAPTPPPPCGRACMKVPVIALAAIVWVALATPGPAHAQKRERARDVGIPLEGVPGPLDAITDVAGVEVGHRTLVAGSGKLIAGKGPVRTGVTAVFPRGKTSDDPVFAGWFTMHGNGEMTGTTWVEESGLLWGPAADRRRAGGP